MKYYEEYKGFTNEELCFLAQEGNTDAKKYLVEKNVKFINMFVLKYTPSTHTQEYDDLFSEACIGFIKAIDGFDTTKGFKFNTYAGQYVNGAILLSLRTDSNGKCFRIGREQRKLFAEIPKVEDELAQKLGRTPTLEETAEAMDMTVRELSYIINLNKGHQFLEESIVENERQTNSDILLSDKAQDKKVETDDQILTRLIIDEAISKLRPRRQEVLKMLYWDGYTQAEVAKIMGVTQCVISREKIMGERMLKHMLAKELNIPVKTKKINENCGHNMKIRCITTGEEFGSLREAEAKYGVYHGGISRAANGKQRFAGKHPETGEGLRWEKVK